MESKKIGILTHYYNNHNYGGCLQAFALVEQLQKMGYSAEQICYIASDNISVSQKIRRSLKSDGFFGLLKIIFILLTGRIKAIISKQNPENKNIIIRSKAMSDFRNFSIPHSQTVYYANTISKCKDYDTYICGSDQVWRFHNSRVDAGYWLTFAADEAKRISYAASVSMKEIPKKHHAEIKQTLLKYRAISVREEEAKEQIEEIVAGEKLVERVLDPTLLMTGDEWNAYCAENPYEKESYIFAYLLGDKKEDRRYIKDFAERNQLKIITIPYLLGKYRSCDKKFGDIQLFDVNPALFLSLIRDAKYVMTDSFHGTVFSCLFHREFYLFKRSTDNDVKSMNSRIYSLLSLFDCEDRIISPFDDQKESRKDINFEKIEEVLQKEREKSKNFLYEALKN